jgi:hypothetical protein
VADADEAVGDHVQQEAAEELVDVELHDLHAVPVGVIPPSEADAAVDDGAQPVVGERDAVGIAAEGGEDVLQPGDGRRAVDDPGRLAQLAEAGGKGRGRGERRQPTGEMQLAPVEGPLQPGEIPAPARCAPSSPPSRRRVGSARPRRAISWSVDGGPVHRTGTLLVAARPLRPSICVTGSPSKTVMTLSRGRTRWPASRAGRIFSEWGF